MNKKISPKFHLKSMGLVSTTKLRSKICTVTSFFVLLASCILTLPSAVNADMIGGVNFGTAGPSDWGILAIGGSGATGFGTSGTKLSINGPGAGVYGTATQANIGIGGTGQASGWGGGTPHPTVGGRLYYTSSNTGINTSGVTIGGGTQQNNALLSNAANDAAHGLAFALSLIRNMPGVSGINTSQTINPINPGGQNVLYVGSGGINLGNHETLTLGGPAGTNWVIVDTGNLILNSGTIALAAGLTPFNDLIIVKGKIATSGGLNNESVINGVLVDPKGTAQFSPGMLNGELIDGGSQITFVSGGSVNVPRPPASVPEPSILLLLGSGLAGLWVWGRKRG